MSNLLNQYNTNEMVIISILLIAITVTLIYALKIFIRDSDELLVDNNNDMIVLDKPNQVDLSFYLS
jgi:hypothetical protein